MKNLISLLMVLIAIFSLCSCSPKNNTEELVDPSSRVNWHGAPFDKCNEYGELLNVSRVPTNYFDYTYRKTSSEYGRCDYAYVSTTPDGGFFYALICKEGIGWCLDTYQKASDDYYGKAHTYKGVKYDLDNPLSSYQLTFEDPDTVPCFAWKADNGIVYVQKALHIIKTKNLIEGSIFPEENEILEGYWYYVVDDETVWFPTQVFTYYGVNKESREPRYVNTQVNYGTDVFDSSNEGWDKGKISAIIAYYNNGYDGILWPYY